MRLIDVDAFKQELKENYTFYGFTELLNDFYVALDEQPTIEPKCGEWINTAEPYMSDNIVCSVCGYNSICEYNYCPNCGCAMTKEGE